MSYKINTQCHCGNQVRYVKTNDLTEDSDFLCIVCAKNDPEFPESGDTWFEPVVGTVPISHRPESVGVLKRGS